MTNSQLIWQARTTSAPRPVDPIYSELDSFVGVELVMETLSIKVLAQTADVRTPDNRTFGINIRKQDRDMLTQAGYTLPTEPGDHAFTAPVVCELENLYGVLEMRIKKVKNAAGEWIEATKPETVTRKPHSANNEPIDKSLYKYHGETVTVFSAIEKGYGNRKIWRLEARAEDNSLVRIEAWSNHERMIKDAGYPALPADKYAGKMALDMECVIEYDMTYQAYRITHVFPQAVAEPVLAVADAPVRVIIPVTVEMSLEDEIRAFWNNPAYNEPFGYLGILDIINRHVPVQTEFTVTIAAARDAAA